MLPDIAQPEVMQRSHVVVRERRRGQREHADVGGLAARQRFAFLREPFARVTLLAFEAVERRLVVQVDVEIGPAPGLHDAVDHLDEVDELRLLGDAAEAVCVGGEVGGLSGCV